MKKPMYKKLEPSNVRGVCVICNKNLQKKKSGGLFKSICSPCDKILYSKESHKKNVKNSKRPFRKFVKPVCESCGFVPKHICQLDVDHVDGNHENNHPSNLKTLCANCHRLKTYINKDWIKEKPVTA